MTILRKAFVTVTLKRHGKPCNPESCLCVSLCVFVSHLQRGTTANHAANCTANPTAQSLVTLWSDRRQRRSTMQAGLTRIVSGKTRWRSVSLQGCCGVSRAVCVCVSVVRSEWLDISVIIHRWEYLWKLDVIGLSGFQDTDGISVIWEDLDCSLLSVKE